MAGRGKEQQANANVVSARTSRSQTSKKLTAPPGKNATQLQLQKPAAVDLATAIQAPTAQQVDQQQSQELMQIMIHASLSSVLYFRSCLPEDCFETRACLNNSSQYKYSDYTSGDQGMIQNKVGGYIRALSKGVSARADRFLHLLETGIFDAFQRGYLSSVHLTMFEEAEFPDNVLESWTLSFHYADVSGQRSLLSMDLLSDQAGSKITLSRVKLSLNDLIRKLGHSCAELPALPEERHMRVEIGYTNNRPDSYFAPGFEEPVRCVFTFASGENWERNTMNAGLVYTGHHAVALKGSHLSRINADVENALPTLMQYTEEVSRLEDVVPDLGERAERMELSRLKSHSSKRNTIRSGESSPKNAEVQELRGMLQPLENPSNTQATQPTLREQKADDVATGTYKLKFSMAVIDDADRVRDATLPRQRYVLTRTVHEPMDGHVIKCACGHAEDEGDSILCQFCHKWQHLHCMGYTGKNDAKIPSTYLCYECLLGQEERSLQQQRERAVYRRALWLLRQTNFENAQTFGRAINYSEHEAKMVMQGLREHGLLKKTGKRSKWQVVLDASAATQSCMEMYCDPSIGIERYLEPTSFSDEKSQVSMRGRAQKRSRMNGEEQGQSVARHCIYGGGTISIEAAHTPKRARQSS
ncbi:hypothetical protein IAQ61_009931 [Plenodomus lingam]|uniref:HORMA domain-containing protein n=1 Tax=Leptosphaeria maculans (strain JN3 / isolate v23.1.3 / race Av1-4-5-6-7-8) TaxID=985895 RepID=E4ZSI3_LEPMJ|nr:hypothetical protein LEMA_P121270.1 [Plenodomus lingam JN3]KAH9862514.1 hypothetical protein IAQ61_009931 [Plenodomus lingam]CBX94363.1 hypothetical protein LEMA_P121270.1 [Plenodomus lingam JN3]